MKLFAIVAIALPLTALASSLFNNEQDPDAKLWKAWKHKYSKEYETGSEELARFNIWKDNLERVMNHNARYDVGLETFFLSMNKFADMTSQEFAAQRNGLRSAIKSPGQVDMGHFQLCALLD